MKAHKEGSLDESLIDELIMGNWPRGKRLPIRMLRCGLLLLRKKGVSRWSRMSMILLMEWFRGRYLSRD